MSSLLQGKEFVALVEKLRSKLEADKARLLAKGRTLNVRVSEYIAAQRGDDVKASIRWLLGGRSWRYVSFAEFVRVLGSIVDRMHEELKGDDNVCFVVDSFNKSSFWVIVMAMMIRSFPNASLAIDDYGVVRRRSLKTLLDLEEDTLRSSFSALPDDTRLVLMDDAAYSGEQLSYFHKVVIAQWNAAKKKARANLVIALPFMSRPATTLFRRKGTVLIVGETFPGLFDRRTPTQVIDADVYLEIKQNTGRRRVSPLKRFERKDPDGTAAEEESANYVSLFFDVIGLLPTNTMFVFEHKVGDALSIPNRWLKVGQCVPPNVTSGYRIKKNLASKLVSMIRSDLVAEGIVPAHDKKIKSDGPWSPSYRLMLMVSARVRELLASSRAFRDEFFDRFELPSTTDDGGKPVPFLPLISPEFCDAPYRRYVRLHRVERGKLGLVLPNSGEDIPPCRRPPYKRTSYRNRLFA